MTLAKSAVANRLRNLDPQIVAQYLAYWESIQPQSLEERWQRWVFAAMAINTGWEQNVDAYKIVMAVPWKSLTELEETLASARIGLPRAKSLCVWNITAWFRDAVRGPRILGHPADVGRGHLPWSEWRDHLHQLTDDAGFRELSGAGLKTISFAHEMCWPRTCRVLAIDTHVARWYGVNSKTNMTPVLYHEIEEHWLAACKSYDLPSAIARHVLWDQEHGHDDTRYWSYVFEGVGLEIPTVGA